ncbi:hypothetical protein AAIH46_02985 [Rhizobium sp. 0TCS1.26]|uniref:hypothetical protein n=1 Tax=Rhizobium sp. 0TCS1.26 TaxID=3142623 RepID=UPI003D2DAE90
MKQKIFDWLGVQDALEATGTYADGVFYLTRDETIVETRSERLRISYGRDFRTAHRIADTVPVLH